MKKIKLTPQQALDHLIERGMVKKVIVMLVRRALAQIVQEYKRG